MATAKRRVSYILPSPVDHVPRLQLPPHGISRLGATGPLLMQYRDQKGKVRREEKPTTPRHRLGVASLALDTSTLLEGKHSPEGILYSGGRDGLLMSWDLSMPMKRRKAVDSAPSRSRQRSWELMTGWDDDVDEEADDADDRLVSDGDVLGDVTASLKKRRRADQLPHEREWETDLASFQLGTVRRVSGHPYRTVLISMIYRKHSSDSARKRTQTGLMISFSVITTRLWYLHHRMEP